MSLFPSYSSIERGVLHLDTTSQWHDKGDFVNGCQNEIRFTSQILFQFGPRSLCDFDFSDLIMLGLGDRHYTNERESMLICYLLITGPTRVSFSLFLSTSPKNGYGSARPHIAED